MTFLTPILKSKWFWITVVVLIAIWLIYPRLRAAIRNVRTPDLGNYAGQQPLNAADKARIEALAADTREEFYGMPSWGGRDEVATRILAMNDREIRYLAEFYKQIADGNSLLSDVESEWSWTGDLKQRLIAKLLQLNA